MDGKCGQDRQTKAYDKGSIPISPNFLQGRHVGEVDLLRPEPQPFAKTGGGKPCLPGRCPADRFPSKKDCTVNVGKLGWNRILPDIVLFMRKKIWLLVGLLSGMWQLAAGTGMAQESTTIDEKIDWLLDTPAEWISWFVFYKLPIAGGVPVVLVLLAGTAVFLTVYFRFINLRALGLAVRTVRGRYTSGDAPGEITHFQALTTALSATVGLGNIAGVAVAVGLGGPGATFWMIIMGLFGMTTKFCECTLGVKYRKFDSKGKVHGGPMYYLKEGLREHGFPRLGRFLAVLFAILIIGGSFGAGNMFQANQAHDQVSAVFAPDMPGYVFGFAMAVMVGFVIIGGIVWIARVTSFLVPFMCVIYLIAAFAIIFLHLDQVLPAFQQIIRGAFDAEAVAGGLVGVLIQGIKRAAFSNEAGLGSAPIAHSAVKTNKPASEGLVALLEPFTDTVVVCTMTALVIIISGTWQVDGSVEEGGAQLFSTAGGGEVVQGLEAGQLLHLRNTKTVGEGEGETEWREVIGLVDEENYYAAPVEGWIEAGMVESESGVKVTSRAFEQVISWFPKVLAVAVFLFAFSTMISWSYYGEQGVIYLFRGFGDAHTRVHVMIYKIAFCLSIVAGASASLNNVITLSDSMVFAMVVPNLIGVYLLLPVVKRELASYLEFTGEKDRADSGEGDKN